MGQKTRTGRESTTLKDVVQHQQHAKQHHQRVGCNTQLHAQDSGAEAEGEACRHAQQ